MNREETILDTNPFFEFHSDRSRVSRGIPGYKSDWLSHEKTIDDLVDIHRSNRKSIRFNKSGIYTYEGDSKSWSLLNGHVNYIRRVFEKAYARTKNLDMTDGASICYCSHLVSEYVRQKMSRREMKPYNTDEIVAATGIDPYAVRKYRQIMVNHFFEWIDKGFGLLIENIHEDDDFVLEGFNFKWNDFDGSPLLGIYELGFEEDITKGEFLSFIKGAVLFSEADIYSTRLRTLEAFPMSLDGITPFSIGGGVNLAFNTHMIGDFYPSLLINSLSDIGVLAEYDTVVMDPRKSEHPDVKNYYIRIDDDDGYSDIAGLMILNETYGKFAMIGGMIMDGLDTYKMYLYDPFFGSLAEYAGRYIESNYKKITEDDIISEEEKLKFVYLGARSNIEKINVSLSHRFMNLGSRTIVKALIDSGPKNDILPIYGIEEDRIEKFFNYTLVLKKVRNRINNAA